jgi:hypothetical protein
MSGSHGGEGKVDCLLGYCDIVSYKLTDVSDVLTASSIRELYLLNVGQLK